MKCSLGSAVALVAVAITASALAGEPTPARFGSGMFGVTHARPVSSGIVSDEAALPSGNYAAGNYAADASDSSGAYAPGSCDYQAPCVNGLWNGYVKRPLRCNLGAGGCGAGGCNAGGCNTCRHTYSGFGANGFNLGRIFACQSSAGGCDSCGAAVAVPATCGCDADIGAPCGAKPCRSCGFKRSGLGRFWTSSFGDGGNGDCGCSDTSFTDNNDGPAPHPAANPADDVIRTLRAPVPPADNGPAPAAIIPAPKPTEKQPAALSLPEAPAADAAPEAAPLEEKPQRDVGPDPEARRTRPTYRGFSSFGR